MPSPLLATCCRRSCRVGWPGSRYCPEGPRGCVGALCSFEGPGERARCCSGGEGPRETAGDEECLAIVGRSALSGLEKREDNLFAAMVNNTAGCARQPT